MGQGYRMREDPNGTVAQMADRAPSFPHATRHNIPNPSHTHDSLVHVHLPVGPAGDIQVGQLPLVVL